VHVNLQGNALFADATCSIKLALPVNFRSDSKSAISGSPELFVVRSIHIRLRFERMRDW